MSDEKSLLCTAGYSDTFQPLQEDMVQIDEVTRLPVMSDRRDGGK